MLYMKDTRSVQSYDQEAFRICSRNIAKAKDMQGNVISVNRKSNVYLIDFNIARMFQMTMESAQLQAKAKGETDITKLEETYFEYDLTALKECVKTQSNPELINNGAETAPSKRIMDCIGCFDKANVGVDVLEKIGIENIAAKCHHFSEWMKHIEERTTRI